MNDGSVVDIYITPETAGDMVRKRAVEAVESRGLRGDRYYSGDGIWNEMDGEETEASDVTFIEAEAIEAVREDYDIDLGFGDPRRNVVTRDVALNHLVGERFTVGNVVCEGVGLCSPCGYMQGLVGKGNVAEALTHRGGLDATVVESGEISVGDTVEW